MERLITKITSEDLKSIPELKRLVPDEDFVGLIKESMAGELFGQDEALTALARCVARHETGLSDPSRPLSVLFFLGPTGVGKTEASYALADFLFMGKKQPKIINCAELQDQTSITRFVGASPNYVGYGDPTIITPNDLIGRSIIVFDEIEKAHPDIWKLLLGVMDTGKLRVRAGSRYGAEEIDLDFTSSYIIFTSNVGAKEVNKKRGKLGFIKEEEKQSGNPAMGAVLEKFSNIPEFLGRMDEFIVFKHLDAECYKKIMWKFIARKNMDNSCRVKGFPFLTVSSELADYLTDLSVGKGSFGARDMKHTLDATLFHSLSNVIGKAPLGSCVVGDLENGKIIFYVLEPPVPQLPEVIPPDEPQIE